MNCYGPCMRAKDSYHHGSLRAALLEAATDILENEGLEALSLRKVAAKVGVSHAAPAHHFPAMRDLLTGIAAIGYERFDEALRSERARSAPDPVSQLRAAERGYMAHARAHPALFRLMFTETLLDWDNPVLQMPARAARAQLTEICAPAADKHGLRTEEERLELEQLVWAQIHGKAHLFMDRKLPDQAIDTPDEQAGPALDLAELLFR